ncbi:signal peptidase II [Mariniblastus sp.]|nr:signal peptidase II [Mariniblastus sp.]
MSEKPVNPSDSIETSSDVASTSGVSIAGGRPSMGRYALFFLPAIIGLAADLITKSYMFANHFSVELANQGQPQQKVWWVDGIFGIQTSTNPGALFGIGKGYSWLFAIFSIIAVVGILLWLFRFGGIWDRWLTFAMGLVTGGIFGNLYDRLGYGYTPGFPESIRTNVRDWVLFQIESIPIFNPWPNFNIADSVLVAGAIMLFLHAFFFQADEAAQESKT